MQNRRKPYDRDQDTCDVQRPEHGAKRAADAIGAGQPSEDGAAAGRAPKAWEETTLPYLNGAILTPAVLAKDVPRIDPRAGHAPSAGQLVDTVKLIDAYYARHPDPQVPAERVAFGTSGHRGSSFDGTFNEAHVLAITQAICLYRRQEHDFRAVVHRLRYACAVAARLRKRARSSGGQRCRGQDIEERRIHADAGDFPGHPGLQSGRENGLADGIVITPSHNPPEDGGFKYNPPNGGPADTGVTSWIEKQANALLSDGLAAVERVPFQQARRAGTTAEYDFLQTYVADLANVIDFDAIRASGIRMGVDPLGGAGVHYWARIAEHYRSTSPWSASRSIRPSVS